MTQHIHSMVELLEAADELLNHIKSITLNTDKHTETMEKLHRLVNFLLHIKQGTIEKDVDLLDNFFTSLEQLVEQRPLVDVMAATAECYPDCDDPNCPYIH